MSAQHTPGPWCVNDLYADTEIRGPENSGAMICVMSPWGIAADDPSPQRANARLIAAAPDLLAATEALLDAITGANGSKELTAIHAAVCAIHKARGAAK